MLENVKRYIKRVTILEKAAHLFKREKIIDKSIPIKTIIGDGNIISVDQSSVLSNCAFDIIGNNNEITIDKSGILNNLKFYIRGGSNRIKIGKKVKFNRGGLIWIEDHNCQATIGEGTTFEDVHLAVTESNSKLSIGSECMFAYDIDVRTGDSHSIIDCATNQRINPAKDVIIGNHVWIASHVSILKGVQLSDNSIVATRSVVTRSFEETNILIGGTPAKKLKENITWDRQRL